MTDDAKEDYCIDAGKIPTTIFGADSANWLTEKGINSHEDLVKRVRDTFTPTKDTFERMAEQAWSVCDCYTNYQITAPMPEYLFGDSFGYDMQKDIGKHMSDYYAGRMSSDELDQYFHACCTEMRKYQAQCHRSSGNADEDNRKIISQVYEIFAKENARIIIISALR